MQRIKYLICLMLGGFTTGCLVAQTESHNSPLTLCTIVEQFSSYEGKRIVVDAEVLSDARHGAFLVRSECKKGLAFDVPDPEHAGDDIKLLLQLLDCPVKSGTIDKKIAAHFRGTVRKKANGEVYLELEAVWRMLVSPRKAAKKISAG